MTPSSNSGVSNSFSKRPVKENQKDVVGQPFIPLGHEPDARLSYDERSHRKIILYTPALGQQEHGRVGKKTKRFDRERAYSSVSNTSSIWLVLKDEKKYRQATFHPVAPRVWRNQMQGYPTMKKTPRMCQYTTASEGGEVGLGQSKGGGGLTILSIMIVFTGDHGTGGQRIRRDCCVPCW